MMHDNFEYEHRTYSIKRTHSHQFPFFFPNMVCNFKFIIIIIFLAQKLQLGPIGCTQIFQLS